MTGKLLTRLFALFGMTLTCVACYGTMYDEYHPEFAASGRVVDDENNPIENIEVSLGSKTAYSNADGRFYVRGVQNELVFTDADGEANGGEFLEHRMPLESGTQDVGDVKLERKK
jgi:hypothetical protein